ncbi:MAG: conserved hypothetical protein [Methanobrevibacter sp. CfCl-M3]
MKTSTLFYSLERTIINNYVKKIKDYDKISKSVEKDIGSKLREYVLASWYNNWSSILIESMFNNHPDILPAIGKIKKIDFFWRGFPFDLKVTYFPDEFIQLKRKEKNLEKEITELKKFAKTNNIYYNKKNKPKEIFSELLTKITEDPSKEYQEFIKNFHEVRKNIIEETISNPKELIKWLYENQGTRRFDASNRLFLILIDLNNLENSWKLKRNKKILENGINTFLDENSDLDFNKLKLSFNWENNEYNTYAISLFIFK